MVAGLGVAGSSSGSGLKRPAMAGQSDDGAASGICGEEEHGDDAGSLACGEFLNLHKKNRDWKDGD